MTIRPIYVVSLTPFDDPDVIHLPVLATVMLEPPVDLAKVDGIIFTSKNGVDALEKIAPAWKTLPSICVGKATQRRVQALGGEVVAVGEGYGEMLRDLIRTRFPDSRWLYARPEVVASDFAQQLRAEGITVDEAVVYQTVCRADRIERQVEPDAVLIFTSPSAAACFQTRYTLGAAQSVVVIGHTTGNSLPGLPVHTAPEPTVAACVTLAKQLAKEPE